MASLEPAREVSARVSPPSSLHSDLKGNSTSRYIDDDSTRVPDETASDLGDSLTNWTESTDVPRRSMGVLQVGSLMINQMIGYGIFANPGTVLVLTGSKSLALTYWAIGGVFQLLSAPMFLEYAIALPYTGGPLIWLDETFHKPRMLVAFIFSWFWVLCSISGNCQGVAQFLLALTWPNRDFRAYGDGMIRFVAVVVMTVACLCLYFARRIVFIFNSAFAVLKIVFLLVLIGAGLRAAVADPSTSGLGDFYTVQPHGGSIDSLSAILAITYSYQGWEHTNYIAGEIRRPERSLKIGVWTSLLLVTCLYILVVAAFYAALPYDTIAAPAFDEQAGIAFILSKKVFGSTMPMNVIGGLSSWSCLLAYTYTDSKVKQAMAWQRILPFSKFFGRQDRQFDSAGGALFLHWLITILTVGALPYFSKSSVLWNNMFDYGYFVEIAALTLGLLFLVKKMNTRNERWRPRYFKLRSITAVYVFVVGGFCCLVLVVTALGTYPGTIPDYYVPVALACIILAAMTHWATLMCLRIKLGNGGTIGQRLGFEVYVYSIGLMNEQPQGDLYDSVYE